MVIGIASFIVIVGLVVALAWHHEKKFDGYEEVYDDLD